MKESLWVARLYLVENVRRQVHLLTLFMAALLLMLPAFVNTFSLGMTGFERVAKDFGLTLMAYFGTGLAIFLASTAVPGDIEGRTLYPLLARPMARAHYLMGKLVGIATVLGTSLLVLSTCLFASLAMLDAFDPRLFLVALGDWLELSVLAAACLAFSTFASPALAAVLGCFIYLVGGLSDAFVSFFLVEDRHDAGAAAMANALRAILPHFQVFRIKSAIVHGLPVPDSYLPSVGLYALAWTLFFLMGANLLFARKDL